MNDLIRTHASLIVNLPDPISVEVYGNGVRVPLIETQLNRKVGENEPGQG